MAKDNREYLKAYRKKNKEKLKQKRKAYCEEHRDEIKAKAKACRDGNKGETKRRNAEYYKKNSAHIIQTSKEYYQKNKANYERKREETKQKRKEYRKSRKEHDRKQKKEYRVLNKEKIKKKSKEYQTKNAEALALVSARYAKANQDKRRKYFSKRRKDDVNFRLACALRSRINKAVRGIVKKGSAVRDLGCSVEEARRHIESKFVEGMNWDTYGLKGWHIDHVRPLSSFNLEDRKQFLEACHYTNLQPLWAIDNIKKRDLWPLETEVTY